MRRSSTLAGLMAAEAPRRRPRRGSLERPVSTRIYRAAWLVVAVPVLVAAFSVGRPDALPAPRVQPFFDQATAVQFADGAREPVPEPLPGNRGPARGGGLGRAAAPRLRLRRRAADVLGRHPGRRHRELVNLVAVAPRTGPANTQANRTIVVMAHRDNIGRSPGADDNASGTGALLELARDLGNASLSHPIVLVSTDGGAYGGLGAAHFAESRPRSPAASRGPRQPRRDRVAAARRGSSSPATPRGCRARRSSPPRTRPSRRRPSVEPKRPGALAQLVDLAFPFSFYEQAPFVSRGVPAVTITTSGQRARARPRATRSRRSNEKRIGELGRAAQMLVASLDESAEVASGTQSYLYFGTRILYGWTLQLTLVAALIPFLAATVDLFARCRRRHIALLPALRSYLSRLGVWLWVGLVFALFVAIGLLAERRGPADRARHAAAQGLARGGAGCAARRLGARLARRAAAADADPVDRARRRSSAATSPRCSCSAVVALVVTAVNPYSLLFVLPSLHAWLWLPQVRDRGPRGPGGRVRARLRSARSSCSPRSPSGSAWASTRSGT